MDYPQRKNSDTKPESKIKIEKVIESSLLPESLLKDLNDEEYQSESDEEQFHKFTPHSGESSSTLKTNFTSSSREFVDLGNFYPFGNYNAPVNEFVKIPMPNLNSFNLQMSNNSYNLFSPHVNPRIKTYSHNNLNEMISPFPNFSNFREVSYQNNFNNFTNNYYNGVSPGLVPRKVSCNTFPINSGLKNIKNEQKLPKKNFSGNLITSQTNPFQIYEEMINDDVTFENFVERIGGDLIPFIKTQRGSRLMQKFLNKVSAESVDRILDQLSPNLKEIMVDGYGNYFIQRLTQCCSTEQRVLVLGYVAEDFLEIANNNAGTHSIQSLIEIINSKEEMEILRKCVEPHILRLAYNTNGTHIIQKIISCFEESNRNFLNDFILANLVKMCLNANGICVIKRYMNANKDLAIRDKLLKKFEQDCIEIVEDAFGNYAIQHAIDVYGTESCSNLINKIIHPQNIISLCNQKFSSNVVEKCIQTSNKETFRLILKEMFYNTSNFTQILKNKYGNFVIQKVILKMSQKEKCELKEHLLKKVSIGGGKEKNKLNSIMELL